jgi:hypothetical protein
MASMAVVTASEATEREREGEAGMVIRYGVNTLFPFCICFLQLETNSPLATLNQSWANNSMPERQWQPANILSGWHASFGQN